MRYWVESEELWSANDGGVVWRGRPDGHPAVAAVPLAGTDDAIVLLSTDSGPRTPLGELKGWPNLIRIRPEPACRAVPSTRGHRVPSLDRTLACPLRVRTDVRASAGPERSGLRGCPTSRCSGPGAGLRSEPGR